MPRRKPGESQEAYSARNRAIYARRTARSIRRGYTGYAQERKVMRAYEPEQRARIRGELDQAVDRLQRIGVSVPGTTPSDYGITGDVSPLPTFSNSEMVDALFHHVPDMPDGAYTWLEGHLMDILEEDPALFYDLWYEFEEDFWNWFREAYGKGEGE